MKQAISEASSRAEINVTKMSKHVNHVLNMSGDLFMLRNYQKYAQNNDKASLGLVFKRLKDDTCLKTRRDLLLRKIQ